MDSERGQKQSKEKWQGSNASFKLIKEITAFQREVGKLSLFVKIDNISDHLGKASLTDFSLTVSAI